MIAAMIYYQIEMIVDPEGKFIRLTNQGVQQISLNGCNIVQHVDLMKVASYRFNRQRLAPGASVEIWSANSEREQERPSTLVMHQHSWSEAVGVMKTTKLSGKNGYVMITQISSILPEAVVGGITATVGYSVAFCNRWPILRLVLMAFVALLFFKFLID